MREERHPFTAEERMEFLESVLGNYFYYSITKTISQDTFSLYYSDKPEIILNWFTEDLKQKIDFVFLDRKDLLEGLSAMKIRKALREDDFEYLEKYLPEEIYAMRNGLKAILNTFRKKISKIVITGGPCAGKTTAMS